VLPPKPRQRLTGKSRSKPAASAARAMARFEGYVHSSSITFQLEMAYMFEQLGMNRPSLSGSRAGCTTIPPS
jgi:hypothetical protein